MNLEVTIRLNAAVPDDSLGPVSREQLARMAREKVEERLKLLFVGWPTLIEAVAKVDGQESPKN